MKDFVFIKNDFLVPLPDKISLCERDEFEKSSENSKQDEKFALISNEKSPNAQIKGNIGSGNNHYLIITKPKRSNLRP